MAGVGGKHEVLSSVTHAAFAELVQWVKTLVAKPDDLNSIPGAHMVEGGTQSLQVVL